MGPTLKTWLRYGPARVTFVHRYKINRNASLAFKSNSSFHCLVIEVGRYRGTWSTFSFKNRLVGNVLAWEV